MFGISVFHFNDDDSVPEGTVCENAHVLFISVIRVQSYTLVP